ncbi:hypothetical protein ILT44_11050 [Microvirga sp. BT689]|uniref:S8 family serine peptidase n=1 Tax=Microvirga arvi TaxID=2778731 RepID=UPI0019528B58|nr:S8 family serine peptidase [Microvirga arvi]MBM6580720.1 hypothetical protein [Microvirga arvi]
MGWKLDPPPYNPIPRSIIDPYVFWTWGPGLSDFILPSFDKQKIPVLLRQRENKWNDEAWALWRELSDLPHLSEDAPRETERFTTGFLPFDKTRSLLTEARYEPFLQSLDRFTLGPPLPASSVADTTEQEARRYQPLTSTKATAKTVIVGIIDDGIPFAHERFRKAVSQTRVECVWIQDGIYDGGLSGFKYGREIRKPVIDNLLVTCRQGDLVDEDEIYRRLQLADFTMDGRKSLAWRASHGAHVMDIACGWEPNQAPDWRIVCVQLPTATTADSSGASLAPYAVDAVKYIRDKAQEIAGPGKSLPIVINFSYGLLAGPHDGTHEIELAIDEILHEHNSKAGNKPMRLVIPSGNSHLARAHATIAFGSASDEVTLPLRMLPDDHTPSFVEIWLPHAAVAGNRVRLTIETPAGEISPPLMENDNQILELETNGQVICNAGYYFFPAPTNRGMFLISLQPTARIEAENSPIPVDPMAPHGVWILTLTNNGLSSQEKIEVWVQRDDAPYGYQRRGRQAYFDHPCYKRYDEAGRPIEEDDPSCLVKRAGMINAIATGKETVVIGGLLRQELRPPYYSAGGPITPPAGAPSAHRRGPEALTISDDSLVHAGVLGAGTRSGSVVAMNGTSVSAPLITRWIAGELASGRAGNRKAVRKLAYNNEVLLPAPKPSPERGGAGRIILPPVRPVTVKR